VYRLARANTLCGWVLNGEEGVEIYLEGNEEGLQSFVRELRRQPPPAAAVADVEVRPVAPVGLSEFTIRDSQSQERPSVRISPDLRVCNACLEELFDPANPRYWYPYINCTNCGPRYSVLLSLPYDRCRTTMKDWPLDDYCGEEYGNPDNRRFHAQPVACPACGPGYYLTPHGDRARRSEMDIRAAASLLSTGHIVAVKGLGGYHLACDARNPAVVAALRARKFRKEKPFALMARDLQCVQSLVELSPEAENLLTSCARPIILARVRKIMNLG
jgi:hydrogenase maturation protein HypF